MKPIIAAALICFPTLALGQTVSSWGEWQEIKKLEETPLRVVVGENKTLKITKAWQSSGVGPNSLEKLDAVLVVFSESGVFASLQFSEVGMQVGFVDNGAYAATKQTAFFRNKEIQPKDNGSFNFNGANLRWISFDYKSDKGVPFGCAGISGSSRGVRFALSGYWCVANGKDVAEEDVRSFVGAISYKDLLIPTPWAGARTK